MKESVKTKRIKKVFMIMAAVILTALTILVVYVMAASVKGKVANIFGVSVLKVITGSMEPSIHEGDYILVKKTETENLKVDDIVCFYSSDSAIYGMPNTHRIVKILDDGSFVTKGDANKYEDSAVVSPKDVIGKYEGKVRFLRWINSFASLKKLIFLGIIIAMTVAAFYEVKTITAIAKECKEDREASLEEEKKRIIRERIDAEKAKLYEQGYNPENIENNHKE